METIPQCLDSKSVILTSLGNRTHDPARFESPDTNHNATENTKMSMNYHKRYVYK